MMSPPDGTDLRASLSLSLGAAYIIDRELDGTGTARVFVAHEESLDRDVAIVVVAEAVTRGMSAERFARELRPDGMLDEPHTVPVLSVGQTTSGLYYYTMPFVRGPSLRQRIEQGPVGFDESVAVLRDIARAMAHAHSLGLVHRQLVPEQVLLARAGAVVTDFSLAHALARAGASEPAALLTHASFTALPYIAPEQAAGDAAMDQRADIYSWGVMAYELLLDADPFADVTSPTQAAPAPVADVPPLMLFKRHGVPEQLALLVMRCCEFDPATRPERAAELVAVLERIPSRASTLALERKNAVRWVGASIFAALVLFVASGLVVWRLQRREGREAPLIAVLPFNFAGTAADSVLARQLADAVATKLSRLSGLRVIDRGSVLSVMDENRSARVIGRSLGAEYVLRAFMSWVPGTNGQAMLRVEPLVLRVSDGRSTWTGGPEIISPADPFPIQATLAKKTANELDIFLGDQERAALAAHGTRDTAAFSAYSRGDHLYRQNETRLLPMYEMALREFERAYHIDRRYGDALGGAALSLARMAQLGARPSLSDSAVGLARRALLLSPGQALAQNAGAIIALAQDRSDDARLWADRAITANPSDMEALQLHVALLPLIGDSLGTWRDVERLASIAPRSVNALIAAATGAQMLRRFAAAGQYLQRARLLEPERADLVLRVARLGRISGNFPGMARAVREFRRRGGQLTADDLTMLRAGDDAMRQELAESSPEAYAVATRADSFTYYSQKAQLFLARRDGPRARALLDSSLRPLRKLLADSTIPASERRHYGDLMAWTDAARGERVRALAVVTGVERDTIALPWPNGQLAAGIACNSAEIYAFVNDVEQMIQQLRRCLTLPGGYAPSAISAEPSLWRHAVDPRLRALLGEFKLEIRRKE